MLRFQNLKQFDHFHVCINPEKKAAAFNSKWKKSKLLQSYSAFVLLPSTNTEHG